MAGDGIIYRPDSSPADLWDGLARQNAFSAICYHATPEWFERSGERDAEALLQILCAWFGESRPVAGVRVLDIGGGIGRIARYLAGKVGHYLLLDVSPEMLKQATVRLQDLCHKVRLVPGDGFSLQGIGTGEVDFAFSRICFQHCDREVVVSYLREIRRVLAPGGAAWFDLPPMRYPERFADCDRRDWPANFRRWHPGELLEVLARVGLSVVAAECDGIQVLVSPAPAVGWLNPPSVSIDTVAPVSSQAERIP